jgi:phosphoribosylformimino-5-aminoimidazole carboxamide ribotide isomerase
MNSQTKISGFLAIPVIDLMGGEVVHGMGGKRESYRPIRSSLCATSKPLDVVRALSELYPIAASPMLYIADLDAIRGNGSHLQTVTLLREHFPDMEIWLDAGVSSLEQWQPWQHLGLHCVVGSESQRDLQATLSLLEHLEQPVLSLDFVPCETCDQLYDPVGILDYTDAWPERIIVMTLAKVGSNAGPDLAAVRSLQQRLPQTTPQRQIYAAGGIRNMADLVALKAAGAAGVLLASALHNGNIGLEQLEVL